MSYDLTLDKLSEKLKSKLLVQEEHGFQQGAKCAAWLQELQKSQAGIRLRTESVATAAFI